MMLEAGVNPAAVVPRGPYGDPIDHSGGEDRVRRRSSASGNSADTIAGLLRTSWHVYNTDDEVRELL